MLPDRVSNPGPLTYESGALPIALRGPAVDKIKMCKSILIELELKNFFFWQHYGLSNLVIIGIFCIVGYVVVCVINLSYSF